MNKLINKLSHRFSSWYTKAVDHPLISRAIVLLGLFMMSPLALATTTSSIIPVPDTTEASKPWIQVLVDYMINYGGPLIVYGGAIWFLFEAVSGIGRGYKNYQKTQEFSEFKTALVGGIIMASVGILMFVFGGQILTNWKAEVAKPA